MDRQLVNVVRVLAVVLPVGAVVKLTVGEPKMVTMAAEQTTATMRARGAVSDNVLIISIDGLRPDVIEKYDAVVLKRLMEEGAAARGSSTISAGRTLGSHVSMLTGVSPEVHRVIGSDERTEADGTDAVPTIFELAKNAGFTTAAFFSRPELIRLVKPGTLDYAGGPGGSKPVKAKQAVEAATARMLSDRPNVVFVQIGEPACHDDGWMSRRYGRAVARADAAVGQLMTAAEQAYGTGRYTVIVTSAHGGQSGGRGRGLDDVVQIPWIAWGAGVQKSVAVKAPVKTMDTAATVLWLLGVERPVAWAGRAVTPAYTSSAQHAARYGPARAIQTRQTGSTATPLNQGS